MSINYFRAPLWNKLVDTNKLRIQGRSTGRKKLSGQSQGSTQWHEAEGPGAQHVPAGQGGQSLHPAGQGTRLSSEIEADARPVVLWP